MARLGDICEKVTDYVASGSFAALKENVLITSEENYAIMVKTADFSNGFTKSLTYTDKRGYDFLKNSNLFGGELILSNIGSIGKVFKVPYLDRPMTLASNTVMIKTATPELTDYLYYYFLSPAGYKSLLSISSGTSMLKFNKTELKKLEIPIPDIDRQRYIIAVMHKVSDLVALRKEQLAKLDQLVKSRFIEMFGDVIQNTKNWEMRSFSEITSSRLGKMLDSKQKTGNSSYPYLANLNVQWFSFNLENLNQMDFNEKEQIEFELRDGDILVCEGGEIGRCAVWHNELQPCFFQKALHRVRCQRDSIHPDYLAWWFKFNCEHDGFASIAGAKATIAHLPSIKLKQLQVSVPPIVLQEQFAAFVKQIDKSKFDLKQSLEKLETLKKSLMQEYFG